MPRCSSFALRLSPTGRSVVEARDASWTLPSCDIIEPSSYCSRPEAMATTRSPTTSTLAALIVSKGRERFYPLPFGQLVDRVTRDEQYRSARPVFKGRRQRVVAPRPSGRRSARRSLPEPRPCAATPPAG